MEKYQEILEKEGHTLMLNQILIDLVQEDNKEKRFEIHKQNFDLIFKT